MCIDLRARKTVANASLKEDKDAGMYFEFNICGPSVILSSRKRYSSSSLRPCAMQNSFLPESGDSNEAYHGENVK
jgi:hypothetical protein